MSLIDINEAKYQFQVCTTPGSGPFPRFFRASSMESKRMLVVPEMRLDDFGGI